MIATSFAVTCATGLALVSGWLGRRRESRFERPQERPSERRAAGSFETVYFPACDGTRLEGWLFLPNADRAPLVVMAAGLTATKDCLLEPYAWQFVERGMAALIFDYRSFGGSDGLPRHHVDPQRHVQDYMAALSYARNALAAREVIDPARVALWGSSFSGGSALVAAATGAEVQALVVQAPFLETPPHILPHGLSLVRFVTYAVLDSIGILPPIYIPALGRPGEWVFAPSLENPSVRDFYGPAGSDFWRLLPKPIRGGWENRMLARVLTTIDKFHPMEHVPAVQCPILFVAAERDDLVPLEYVERAHASAACSRLTVLQCGHFDLYFGEHGAHNAALQADFLAEALTVPGSVPAFGHAASRQ